MAKVDLELKKAFQELQQQTIETTQKLKLADLQKESLQKCIKHSILTEKELEILPKNVKVYESIGRMFALSSKKHVYERLQSKIEAAKNKIINIESSKEYMERTLKESENSLREMIQQKKELISV